MKEYQCYLGNSEQYCYTVKASNIRNLKIKINNMFGFKKSRWYQKETPSDYPEKSQHFIIKHKIPMKSQTKILVMQRSN